MRQKHFSSEAILPLANMDNYCHGFSAGNLSWF